MPNVVSIDQVKKVAKLVKVNVDGEEEKFANLFSDTLDHVTVLNELNTNNIPETYQVTGLKNVYQTNSNQKATLSQKEALFNAISVDNGKIEIPAVFDR